MPSDFYNEIIKLHGFAQSAEQTIRNGIYQMAINSQTSYQTQLFSKDQANVLAAIFSNEGFNVSNVIDIGNPDEEHYLQINW